MGRRPLRGPFEVMAAKGNVATLRDPETQQTLKDVHGDFLIGVPGLAYNIFIGTIILAMMALHSWLDRRHQEGS